MPYIQVQCCFCGKMLKKWAESEKQKMLKNPHYLPKCEPSCGRRHEKGSVSRVR